MSLTSNKCQISLIFMLASLFQSSNNCSYSNYQDALLQNENPQMNYVFEPQSYDNSLGDSISFGFWTMCIPQYIPIRYPQIELQFNSELAETGQFLFLLMYNNGLKFFNYVELNIHQSTIIHNFVFMDSNQQIQSFIYQANEYESVWHFTFITYKLNEERLIMQITNQNQENSVEIKMELNEIILGGRGQIGNYNLNIFRGRISKLYISEIYQYDISTFQEISDKCKIPKEFENEQVIKIVEGLQIFDGSNSISVSFQQTGNFFFISGWIKYDASQIIKTTTYPLIRISLFLTYNFALNEGDELLALQVTLSKETPYLSSILYIKDYHNFPLYGQNQFRINEDILLQFDSQYLNALQEWHLFSFEYVSYQTGGRTIMSFEFFNELGKQTLELEGRQLINSLYYVYFGKDQYVTDLLKADIYNFFISYNYNEEKYPNFQSCHYSCESCNGPFENNCLNCYEDSYRQFKPDQFKCQCLEDYIDIGNRQCQEFYSYFPSVTIFDNSEIHKSNCQFGYFLIKMSNDTFLCQLCPEFQEINLYCTDCLFNPLTWYLKPLCTKDLIKFDSITDGAMIEQNRDEKDYGLYLIDLNGELKLYPQYLNFCDINLGLNNCFKSNLRHLGNIISFICKPNYYYLNGDCQFTNPFCLLSDENGNCIEQMAGIYQKKQEYYSCPPICPTCHYDIQQEKIVCESCLTSFTLINGDCIQCGIFCQNCQKYIDKILEIEYLKCYKCIDITKYYISFDAINCQENTIKDCDYAFQVIKTDFTLNTIDFYFTPRYDVENFQLVCGRCQYNQIYDFQDQKCLNGRLAGCYYGYTDRIYDIELDEALLDQLGMNFSVEYNGVILVLAFDGNQIVVTGDQICLAADSNKQEGGRIIEFIYECPAYNKNCQICISSIDGGFFQDCIECQIGYYADFSGKCEKCPQQLNCLTCYQQQILVQNNMKKKIRAFYKEFIEGKHGKHQFKLFGQSQNFTDYEVKCEICGLGYELYQDECILSCPKSCLECVKSNGQNYCVLCQQETEGRRMSISNNECIECPKNCQLCRKRSINEIKQINQLFDNDVYIIFSYQCLKAFIDQNYYMDNFFGRAISCISFNCSKSFQINLNLFCSSNDYQISLQQLNIEQDVFNFKKQNIKLEDLISGQSFKEFENDLFYYQANQNSISTIIIIISGNKEQECIIDSGIIQQQFSQNIFTAINIQIEFQLKFQTTFLIQTVLKFINFEKITLNNLKILSKDNNSLKQITFQSAFPLQIFFQNILFEQETLNADKFQFYFENLLSLNIENFTTQNSVLEDIDGFIYIGKSIYNIQLVQLQNFQLKIKLQKSNFCKLDNNIYTSIKFQRWSIQSFIQNGSIVQEHSQAIINDIVLQQIFMESSINNSILFNLQNYQYALFNNILVNNSKLQNSLFLFFQNNSKIENFQLINSNLQLKSFIFGQNTQNESCILKFLNFTFQDNYYDEMSKFIMVINNADSSSSVFMNNFLLSNNQLQAVSLNFNKKQKESSLIYIQSSQVIIDDLKIIRGQGLVEISIFEPILLSISNSKITQGTTTQLKGLHTNLECFLSFVQNQVFLSSFTIFSAKLLIMNNIEFYNIRVINAPIFYYQSADEINSQQNETIIINNLTAKSNILIQTADSASQAIIYVVSSQIIEIQLKNLTFQYNLLNQYHQNYVQDSALLFHIDSLLGDVTIQNVSVFNNTVFNSSASIIYVKCQSLQILQSNFSQNNVFIYENIKDNLIWGFQKQNQENQIIYLNDIENLFPILSTSGNGILTAKNIIIQESFFKITQGVFGGALQIICQLDSTLIIQNTQFSQISNTFTQDFENAGAIYLDGTQSYSITINIESIVADQVFGRFNGGFLYFQTGYQKITLIMQNCTFQNVYAQIGSIFFISSSSVENQLQKQSFSIQSISITNTQKGFFSFIKKYSNFNISLSDKQIFSNNRTLFYLKSNSKLIMRNIIVNTLYLEAILFSEQAVNIELQNIVAFSGNMSSYLIEIQPNSAQQTQINLISIIFENITQNASSLQNLDCIQNINSNQQDLIQNFCPLIGNYQAPNFLNQIDFNFSELCFLHSIQQYLDFTESSVMLLKSTNSQTIFSAKNIIFKQLKCSQCKYGLLGLLNNNEQNIVLKISVINILNSNCGAKGCLSFIKQQQNENRLLSTNEMYLSLQKYSIYVEGYSCINNSAINGSCIYIQYLSALIKNSIFQQNLAEQYGGSSFVKGNQSLILENCLINDNQAMMGGGMVLQDLQSIDYTKLQTLFIENNAITANDEILSVPTNLKVNFGIDFQLLDVIEIINTNEQQVQKVDINYILLPNGQPISSFEIFDIQTRKYQPFNKQLRIIALNQRNIVMKNLTNSFCNLRSQIINISDQVDSSNYNNNDDQEQTNIKIVAFNETSQDYNLDNMKIHFNFSQPKEMVLQISISCNIIKVPIFSQNYPYNIIQQHQNYRLLLNVRSYPCQYGEILSQNENSCIRCQADLGQFSLKLIASKCENKDDVSTLNNTSASLNIKPTFWRPYFETSVITQCNNMPQNCLGGWIEGDQSCIVGHIGALCESCDIDNLRGDGHYSVVQKFQCNQCSGEIKNFLTLILVSLWIFISIFLSVQSTRTNIEGKLKFLSIKKFGQFFKGDTQRSGILLKLLTNYLQIIDSLSTFSLNLPTFATTTIDSFGQPTKQTVYSIDCFLTDFFNIEIHYGRMIWQIITTITYINFFFFCSWIGAKFNLFQINQSVISTSLIYLYIYISPSLIGSLVELISFREVSSYQWILANVAYRYDTTLHYQWMTRFCLPILFLLAFFIPSILIGGLIKNKKKLDLKVTSLRLGYLYIEYKRECYYWEIVKIIQKELIIIFLTYYEDAIVTKGILLLLILFFYIQLNLKYSPYLNTSLNRLDYYSSAICLISVALSCGIYVSRQSNNFLVERAYTIFLFVINIHLLLKFIFNIIAEYLRENKTLFTLYTSILKGFIKTKLPFLKKFLIFKSIFEDKELKKNRIQDLFEKLRIYLRQQARIRIGFKIQKIQSLNQIIQNDNNYDLVQSLRSQASQDEKIPGLKNFKFPLQMMTNRASENQLCLSEFQQSPLSKN